MKELRGAEVADAGKNDFGGGADEVGVLGDGGGCAEIVERLDDAGKVAGFVVDDVDHEGSSALYVVRSTDSSFYGVHCELPGSTACQCLPDHHLISSFENVAQ